jgi:hypothetical protein
MRFDAALAAALLSGAALLGNVYAQEAPLEDTSSSTAVVESSTSTALEKPTFTVCALPRTCSLNNPALTSTVANQPQSPIP